MNCSFLFSFVKLAPSKLTPCLITGGSKTTFRNVGREENQQKILIIIQSNDCLSV